MSTEEVPTLQLLPQGLVRLPPASFHHCLSSPDAVQTVEKMPLLDNVPWRLRTILPTPPHVPTHDHEKSMGQPPHCMSTWGGCHRGLQQPPLSAERDQRHRRRQDGQGLRSPAETDAREAEMPPAGGQGHRHTASSALSGCSMLGPLPLRSGRGGEHLRFFCTFLSVHRVTSRSFAVNTQHPVPANTDRVVWLILKFHVHRIVLCTLLDRVQCF